MKRIILALCSLILLCSCSPSNEKAILKDQEEKLIIKSIIENKNFRNCNFLLSFKIGINSLILNFDNLYISLNYSKGFQVERTVEDEIEINGNIHTLAYSYEFSENGLTDNLIQLTIKQDSQSDITLYYDPLSNTILNSKKNEPALLDETYQSKLLIYFQNLNKEYIDLFNSTVEANSEAASIIRDEVALFPLKTYPLQENDLSSFLPTIAYPSLLFQIDNEGPMKIHDLDQKMQLIVFASFIDYPITTVDDIQFESYFAYINQLFPGEYTCFKPESIDSSYYSQSKSIQAKSNETFCKYTNKNSLFSPTNINIPENHRYAFYSSDYFNELISKQFLPNIHFSINANKPISSALSQSKDLNTYITILHYFNEFSTPLNGIYIESTETKGTLTTFRVKPYSVRESRSPNIKSTYTLNNLGHLFIIHYGNSITESIESLKDQLKSIEITIDTQGDSPKIVSIKSL